MKTSFHRLSVFLAITLLFYLTLPLLSIIAFSFSGKIEVIPTDWTFKWYTMRWETVLRSIKVSLMITLPALLLAFSVSLPLAMALVRRKFRGKAVLDQMIVLPILIPGTVYGLALLQLFNTGWLASIPPLLVLVLAHTAIIAPVVARPIIAALRQMNMSTEEAAQTLGASSWHTFRTVTLPLISPGIVVGTILGFARSINDFIITLFLVSSDNIPLSVYIYNSTFYSIPQLTASNAVILLVVSLGVIMIAERIAEVKYIV